MAAFHTTLLLTLAAIFSNVSSTAGFQPGYNGAGGATSMSRNVLLGQLTPDDQPELQHTRRQFYQSITNTMIATSILGRVSPSIANAASEKLETYTDPDYGFRISTPAEWKQTTQTLSGRRKAIFFTQDSNDGAIDTLMYIAYTPVRDDFTSLASFGSVDAVAQATILPKGELGGNADDSKMISAVSKKNSYYFDYTTTPVVPVEAGSGSGAMTKQLKPVHFRTIFTLVPLKSGAGSTLVTVTMQTSEEKYGLLKGVFDDIIDSFEKS